MVEGMKATYRQEYTNTHPVILDHILATVTPKKVTFPASATSITPLQTPF
jgi:hypothetical protein